MIRRLFVLFAALVLFVPAACGGDDDDTASDEETEEEVEAPEDEPTDEGEDGDEEESDEESSGDSDRFADALEKAGEATIKVTYEVTGENQEPQEFTIAQDPPKFALQADTGLLIDDGEHFISCDATEGGQCVELPREGTEGMAQSILGAFAAPFLAFQSAAESGLSGYDVTGDEEIAGRDAICATIDVSELPGATEGGGSSTSCIDEETGILLLFEGEGVGSTGRIEAVDVSEPTDEDFEPTSDPMSIGG